MAQTIAEAEAPVTSGSVTASALMHDLLESLRAEDRQRTALVTRLRQSVSKGDAMLRELGVETPVRP